MKDMLSAGEIPQVSEVQVAESELKPVERPVLPPIDMAGS
jgi:hypothetical protein